MRERHTHDHGQYYTAVVPTTKYTEERVVYWPYVVAK